MVLKSSLHFHMNYWNILSRVRWQQCELVCLAFGQVPWAVSGDVTFIILLSTMRVRTYLSMTSKRISNSRVYRNNVWQWIGLILGARLALLYAFDLFIFTAAKRRYNKEWHKISLCHLKCKKWKIFWFSSKHISSFKIDNALLVFWTLDARCFLCFADIWVSSDNTQYRAVGARLTEHNLADVRDVMVPIFVDSLQRMNTSGYV
jgi:hypothetical protein